MLKTIRYGVFYKAELLQSFDTCRAARNWMARAPWQYSTLCLSVRSFEVTQ